MARSAMMGRVPLTWVEKSAPGITSFTLMVFLEFAGMLNGA
jgi:hypothetical protein